MGKIICFMNNKGGCGKTTTVSEVGYSWARNGKKILFVDLDAQSNLTSVITDSDPSTAEWDRTIRDAFIGGPELGLPIVHVNDNIDIVPADLSLSNIIEETASQQEREFLLADLLAPVRDMYDFILIDCPPALGLISIVALVAADELVIVTNCDGLSYRGVDMVVQLYNKVLASKRMNPNLRFLGLVITRYKKDNVSDFLLDRYRKEFKTDVIEPVIHMDTKLVQAVTFHKSVSEIGPNSRAAKEYAELAYEIIQRSLIQ